MAEHLVQYWKDSGIRKVLIILIIEDIFQQQVIFGYVFVYAFLETQGASQFWENFGYTSDNWRDPPSDDPKFIRKRAMQLPQCVQCSKFTVCVKTTEMPGLWVTLILAHPVFHNQCKVTLNEAINIQPRGRCRAWHSDFFRFDPRF